MVEGTIFVSLIDHSPESWVLLKIMFKEPQKGISHTEITYYYYKCFVFKS